MNACNEVTIFGQTVQVPPNRVAYNSIRMDFIKMANEAAAQYEKLYKQDGSIQKVINGLGEQMHDCLAPALDHCITTLIQHGVIDIDVQAFAERYQSFAEPCAEAFNDVYDRYAEVVMDEEELNEYRKARREGRARWQGGGFGLAGALSGAVTAGALNLVMGAGHMVFNAIGRTFSSIATSFKLSKIYDDPNTCKTLLKGLRLSVFNLHFALVCCLDELDIDHVPASGLVTPEEHRQGEAILSNVDKLPTEDDKQAALLRVFDLDPYMGSDGVGFLSTSTGPMSEADIYPYLDMIKASDPNVLIITDARQYLREVLIQPDYMIVAKEYTDENGLHVAELATKGTDGYAAAMG